MANFVIQFPLKTESFQEDILDKRFEIGRQIYNTLVNVTQKRYKEMIKTKKYRDAVNSLSGDKKKDKEIWKQISDIRKEYGMSEYSFHADVTKIRKHFDTNIDSATAQKIATALWKAYDKLFFGNGECVHYKKYGTLNSLEGKTNKTGIRYNNGNIVWKGLNIPVIIDKNNDYEQQAFKSDIAYCRILRKFIKNKCRYYVQIVFKGNPPIKVNKTTGEIKHSIGSGDVGLDIGTSTISISSNSDVKIFELADKVHNIEKEKLLLLRKMDRSRRATNPDNYNEDGTVKCLGNKKMIWHKSKHYIKYQGQLKELYRKQADIRKYQHECLANYIISLGDNIYVEDMCFSGLQKRSKNVDKNCKGKYKSRKRFGKSIGNRAPAMLISIIDRKLSYWDRHIIKINTKTAKASQFNHFDGTYNKKSLSERWNYFHGIWVQRDMYSAFLIMNTSDDLNGFDIDKCNKSFRHFLKLHNLEVIRLSDKHNLCSIAI